MLQIQAHHTLMIQCTATLSPHPVFKVNLYWKSVSECNRSKEAPKLHLSETQSKWQMQKEWCLTPTCTHGPPSYNHISLKEVCLHLLYAVPWGRKISSPQLFLLKVEQPLLVAHGLQPLATLIALLQQRPSSPVQMRYIKTSKILLKRKFWYMLTSCERFILTFKASSILQFMLRESLLGKFVSSSDQTDEGNQTWQS